MSAVASLSPVSTAGHPRTQPTVKLLIGGEFVESRSAEWREVVNPATQEVLARVPFATRDEVDAAIRSAHAASPPGSTPRWAPACASCSSTRR